MCNVNKDQVPTATNNPFNKENSTRKKVEITHVRFEEKLQNDIWNFWHSISLIHSTFIKILLQKRKPGFGPKFKRKLPKKRRFVYLHFWRTTTKVLFFSNLKDTRQAINSVMFYVIWYHLYNFKNVKKYPWRSATFIKVAGF